MEEAGQGSSTRTAGIVQGLHKLWQSFKSWSLPTHTPPKWIAPFIWARVLISESSLTWKFIEASLPLLNHFLSVSPRSEHASSWPQEDRMLARLVKEPVMSTSALNHKGQHCRFLPPLSCQCVNRPPPFPLSQGVCHQFRQTKDLEAQPALLGYKHSHLKLLEESAAGWHPFVIKHSVCLRQERYNCCEIIIRAPRAERRRFDSYRTRTSACHPTACLLSQLFLFLSLHFFFLFTYKCFFNTLRLWFCSYLGHV